MNANELADELDDFSEMGGDVFFGVCAIMLRQQQAEIEALKKACIDECMKRVYADQTTKVMEGYWEEAQAEIEALKSENAQLKNRTIWDKPRESQYVKNTRFAAESREEG